VSVYLVSDINVDKVKAFFIRQIKETSSKNITMRVDEVAFHSHIALATAHRAIQALANEGFLDIKRGISRRYCNTYCIKADITVEERKLSIAEEISFRDRQIRKLQDQVCRLTAENNRLKV
jgi:DNA-binding MurR/RpiR family transcriptional regulator